MPLVSLRSYWLLLKNSAFDPRLCWEPPGGWNWVFPGSSRQTHPHTGAFQRGDCARPRVRALTSGKAPSAKTIISDVFPQPPSPTRTTLTEHPLSGASSPAAWAAFIPGGRAGGRADSRAQSSGWCAAGWRRRARGWLGGTGMWKGRGGGRKWERGGPGRRRPGGRGDTQLR